MSNDTNTTDVPTLSKLNVTNAPTRSPTGSPTDGDELAVTSAPSNSPTDTRQEDIDVIRLPDYTKPESIDGVFIVVPIILLLVIILICCQKKARLHDNH